MAAKNAAVVPQLTSDVMGSRRLVLLKFNTDLLFEFFSFRRCVCRKLNEVIVAAAKKQQLQLHNALVINMNK
jgi:hypothetical protein